MGGRYIGEPTTDRTWSATRRLVWWVKYILAVATGIVTIAGAARALGLQFDVQTKTEARQEHAEIRAELRAEHERSLSRVEAAIDRLGQRIDQALVRGRR